MWMFTKYGFFSAVCARQGDGRHGSPVDPTRTMVRARVRAHLEALQGQYPDLLGTSSIQGTGHTDYAYRIFLPTDTWVEVVARLARETDFDNFKDAVERHQGRNGAPYVHALHDVWEVMHRLQQ